MRIEIIIIVIDTHNSYNAILERTALNPRMIVASTYQHKMDFTTPHGIGEVKGDHPTSRR